MIDNHCFIVLAVRVSDISSLAIAMQVGQDAARELGIFAIRSNWGNPESTPSVHGVSRDSAPVAPC